MGRDGFLKMRKMEFSKWGREMEDGIELPLFQVIDQTGRMAASSRWVIQFHYFPILSLSNHCFWPHYVQSICSIYTHYQTAQIWGHPQTAPRAHGEPGLRRSPKGDPFIFSLLNIFQSMPIATTNSALNVWMFAQVFLERESFPAGTGAGWGAWDRSQAQHIWSQVW